MAGEDKNLGNCKPELEENRDFTDIVGGCGRWQWQIFLIYFVSCFPGAWHSLAMTFFAPNVDHWCARNDEAITANISLDIWKQNMIPSLLTEEGKIHHSQCDRFDTDLNVTQFFMSTPPEKIDDGILDVVHRSNRTVPCHKWEYDTRSHPSTVVNQWDLVCDREWLISIAKSVFMIGYLVAVLVFGQVSDKIGRRPVLLMSAVIFLISGLICAFSVSFVMFVLSRFFVALGASGILTTGFVMVMEVVGVEHRSLFGIGTGLGWSTGYVLLPVIANFIPGWFWLQIAITLPCLLLLILWWFVPESPRWLLTQGQRAKAEKIMKNIAEKNGKNMTDSYIPLENLCDQHKKDDTEKMKNGNVLDLIRTPGLRQKTLNLYFNWSVNSFVYYGISYNTNDLAGSSSLIFLISGAVEFPAVMVTIFIVKKLGRRIPLMAFMVAGGMSCILMFPVPEEMKWLRITLVMCGKFCVAASFDIVYVYSAEIYPTVLRNVGIGTSSMCGRLGSILAPFVRELGSATHASVPYLCFGGLSVVSGVLVLLLPETNNCKIPDTIEEAALFGRKDKIFCFAKRDERRTKGQVSLKCTEADLVEVYESNSNTS